MATVAIDFTKLLEGIPRGAWVAISQDHERVVAYGSDMRKGNGEPDPIILRVPESASALIL